MDDYRLQAKIYRPPHYSSSLDIPEQPKEYAGLVYHLKGGHGITYLDVWDGDGDTPDALHLSSHGIGGWEYSSSPPSNQEIRQWLVEDENAARGKNLKMRSQVEIDTFLITSASLTTIHAFLDSRNDASKYLRAGRHEQLFSLELKPMIEQIAGKE
ncbi:hypothetical protein C0995_008750 [Termitomyces sp. Mi166|nr:hypothetical protein C0995_008750 [Termitomyces sp. Mi166\